MSTSSLVIDPEQSGTAYTADLNNSLEAINSCHSGTTAPTDEVVAGKLWLDISGASPVLKVYSNGWKTLFVLNSTTVDMSINDLVLSGELELAGNASLDDNAKLRFGNSSDLKIYHDSNNSYIKDSGVGNLLVDATNLQFRNADGTQTYASFVEGGSSFLYHNGSEKLTTSSSGIEVTGTLVATGEVTAFSDARIKANIEVIPDALSKVRAIRGVTYDRTDMVTKRHTGVIAQEVQAVLPEAVLEGETLSVAYGQMVGLLIEAIKELEAKVEKLEGSK